MAIQITVSLPIDSADLLVGYGAGAEVDLYSSATFAGIYVEVGTGTPIVSGTESYEIWDSAGTSTTWYKSRIGNLAGTLFSEYSDPFQVGAQDGYTNLVRVKRQLRITNTSDDAFLVDCVDSANAWLRAEVGRFYGPSTDTSRSYDIPYTGQKHLDIAGGVRTVTSLQVRTVEAGSLTTVTSTDYVLRPATWDLLPGLAPNRIEFINLPVGGISYFTAGRDMVVVNSTTFGPADPPLVLTRIADSVAVMLFQSRAAGMGGVVGAEEMSFVVNRVLTSADWSTITLYRGVGPSLYAYPAT